MNDQNLKPVKTKKEARERGRRGGIASGKAKRARKTLREELIALLENGDTQEKISLAMIAEALQGNTKAFEVIRDTIGEKPTDKIEAELTSDINITIE
jgi:hypothetical protein